jgi:hypothetical protein
VSEFLDDLRSSIQLYPSLALGACYDCCVMIAAEKELCPALLGPACREPTFKIARASRVLGTKYLNSVPPLTIPEFVTAPITC